MKRIGFITTNKVFAQSLAAACRGRPDWEAELHPLLDPGQAALDADILRLDAAVVDVADGIPMEKAEAFCLSLRGAAGCRIVLLVPKAAHGMAIRAVKNNAADDFVFYDTSLDYLFTKLAAI
ncbi:MAG: hypothetical protein LBB75_07930 [Oscillospiraceae bacterium]|jgi:hypothetical protein|nr:hypothetical protein [Oscillospiraceae bacterium]